MYSKLTGAKHRNLEGRRARVVSEYVCRKDFSTKLSIHVENYDFVIIAILINGQQFLETSNRHTILQLTSVPIIILLKNQMLPFDEVEPSGHEYLLFTRTQELTQMTWNVPNNTELSFRVE